MLKYPRGRKMERHRNDYIKKVISIDRQLRFFDKTSTEHFYYYDVKICEAIDKIRPDIVFGEPTAFHHLITLEICRQRDILYLFPGSCRYPINRFAFYKYDSLEPYMGSMELMDKATAVKTIEQIVSRKSPPNYMVLPKISYKDKIADKAKVLRGFLEGERNNTPPPLIKVKKNKLNKLNLEKWDEIGIKELDTSKFIMVFPLHMQPESSIDVWGRKYSDQNHTIKEIAKQLGAGEILYIKPNPKSSFEINEELIDLVRKTNNIKALHSTIGMNAIFNSVDLFINVVGTIAIECVLANKPIISLVKTYFNDTENSFNISSFDEIPEIVKTVQNKNHRKYSNEEKIDYINRLNAVSYKGVIADTFLNKNCVEKSNIDNLHEAFLHVIQ
ncbi:hypothetical protein [Flagellimonas sp.]|uniref:hypothetical protein n=1 Tax=Flagellimonas sp. TaxID=2058762 RepID=UPI003BB1D691